MTNNEIVSKLWNLCYVLRDDGVTYSQYATELTYILFLKMAKETGSEKDIPEKYRWDVLKSKDGLELKKYYRELLKVLGEECTGRIQEIYSYARSNIEEPANLKKIITNIDNLNLHSAKEGLDNLYEGLLEKNADEKKSGAGQHFTPRVLIDVMTELIAPQAGEKCNDPACGTFGFMIAADAYVKAHTNNLSALDEEQQKFQKYEAFTGGELLHETHRLALMNAMLHGIEGKIFLGDTLSDQGKTMTDYDVVLTCPPFGTKKGGEYATRDDISFQTSSKQLNFLQVIYRSLKADGKARCAVVVPDDVLFAGGDGISVRRELMNLCNLHTILRLPTGIFYAKYVKTNVLFFTRGTLEKDNTKEVVFYDLRTNQEGFGRTRVLHKSDFEEFIAGYNAPAKRTGERWSKFTREEIEKREDSLDLGLIRDDSIKDYDKLPDPIKNGEEAIAQLGKAIDLLQGIVNELKSLGNKDA